MKLSDIWRYPIKSHGRERLEHVELSAGKTLPFDRIWAVLHEASQTPAQPGDWLSCANFSRGAKAPKLMAINASLDESSGAITLSHPELEDLSINLSTEADQSAFLAWIKPLCPANRAQPTGVYRAGAAGLTDSDFASISLNSLSSLAALSEAAGVPVAAERFRGNLWIEGAEPWDEHDWVGKTIDIGPATLRIVERTERCLATTANPETGERDLDVLQILQSTWGHRDFGVRAEVVSGGSIRVGDAVKL